MTGAAELTAAERKVTVGDEERTIGGGWTIQVAGAVSLEANTVEMKSTTPPTTWLQGNIARDLNLDGLNEIKVGRSASDFIALKTEILQFLLTHTHPVPGVFPGPSTATANPSSTVLDQDKAFTKKTKAE